MNIRDKDISEWCQITDKPSLDDYKMEKRMELMLKWKAEEEKRKDLRMNIRDKDISERRQITDKPPPDDYKMKKRMELLLKGKTEEEKRKDRRMNIRDKDISERHQITDKPPPDDYKIKKRMEQLLKWKAEKEKRKAEERARKKLGFKVCHVDQKMYEDKKLPGCKKEVPGSVYNFAPSDHKFKVGSSVKPIEFVYNRSKGRAVDFEANAESCNVEKAVNNKPTESKKKTNPTSKTTAVKREQLTSRDSGENNVNKKSTKQPAGAKPKLNSAGKVVKNRAVEKTKVTGQSSGVGKTMQITKTSAGMTEYHGKIPVKNKLFSNMSVKETVLKSKGVLKIVPPVESTRANKTAFMGKTYKLVQNSREKDKIIANDKIGKSVANVKASIKDNKLVTNVKPSIKDNKSVSNLKPSVKDNKLVTRAEKNKITSTKNIKTVLSVEKNKITRAMKKVTTLPNSLEKNIGKKESVSNSDYTQNKVPAIVIHESSLTSVALTPKADSIKNPSSGKRYKPVWNAASAEKHKVTPSAKRFKSRKITPSKGVEFLQEEIKEKTPEKYENSKEKVESAISNPDREEISTPVNKDVLVSSAGSAERNKITPSGKTIASVEEDEITPSGTAIRNTQKNKITPSGKAIPSIEKNKITPSSKAILNIEKKKITPSGRAILNVDKNKITPNSVKSDKGDSDVDNNGIKPTKKAEIVHKVSPLAKKNGFVLSEDSAEKKQNIPSGKAVLDVEKNKITPSTKTNKPSPIIDSDKNEETQEPSKSPTEESSAKKVNSIQNADSAVEESVIEKNKDDESESVPNSDLSEKVSSDIESPNKLVISTKLKFEAVRIKQELVDSNESFGYGNVEPNWEEIVLKEEVIVKVEYISVAEEDKCVGEGFVQNEVMCKMEYDEELMENEESVDKETKKKKKKQKVVLVGDTPKNSGEKVLRVKTPRARKSLAMEFTVTSNLEQTMPSRNVTSHSRKSLPGYHFSSPQDFEEINDTLNNCTFKSVSPGFPSQDNDSDSDGASGYSPVNPEQPVTVYVSPFVAMSRGKDNAQKEFHRRASRGGTFDSSPEATGPQAWAAYFTLLLNAETTWIENLCEMWKEYMNHQGGDPQN